MPDFSYFYTSDENDNEVLRERNTKNFSALKVAIENGASESDIVRFADGVAELEQWKWFDEYNNYEVELEKIMLRNASIVTEYDKTEEPLPLEPFRPVVRAGTDILKSLNYYDDKDKSERTEKVASITAEISGVVLDGDEISQGRLCRASVVLLAQKLIAVEHAIVKASEQEDITAKDLLALLSGAITMNPTVKWKTADNKIAELNAKDAVAFLATAGAAQTAVWGFTDNA